VTGIQDAPVLESQIYIYTNLMMSSSPTCSREKKSTYTLTNLFPLNMFNAFTSENQMDGATSMRVYVDKLQQLTTLTEVAEVSKRKRKGC
jgi:hypothetical protein